MIRRLDHVAVAVGDTERALSHFCGRLGLSVVSTEVLSHPHVRLTYLDAGNAYIQLVEPLDEESPIAAHLAEQGEGLHHVCFAVDDVDAEARVLSEERDPQVSFGSGRGRVSAFVPGTPRFGVRIECTEFKFEEDVNGNRGWLDN
jgi:methylmalonyl-CoA/ethylmalonyl-CoA epimerase